MAEISHEWTRINRNILLDTDSTDEHGFEKFLVYSF